MKTLKEETAYLYLYLKHLKESLPIKKVTLLERLKILFLGRL